MLEKIKNYALSVITLVSIMIAIRLLGPKVFTLLIAASYTTGIIMFSILVLAIVKYLDIKGKEVRIHL